MADGYVNDSRGLLTLKLQTSDENHLIKFINFMEAQDSSIKNDRGGSGQIVKYVTLHSRKLVNSLEKYGIINNKSGKEKPYLKMPKDLVPHYIRGIIDGDGCLTDGDGKYQVDLVGSIDIVRYLHDFININLEKLDYDYIYDHGSIKRFTCRKKSVIEKCFKCFYDSATIYLDRKYKIAINALHGRDKIEEKSWDSKSSIRGEGIK